MLPMGPRISWGLSVGVPDAAASLDTSRIALTRSATTMDYFANAAWTDRMPLIVQRSLMQAFENSGRIASVARDTAGLETDFLLETEVRDFQARYDTATGAPEIMVGIQAKLVRMPQRQIVGSLNAMQQAQAASNNLDAIVMAFNQAFGGTITEICTWVLNTPANAPGMGQPPA
jgi:cholesterol transport system auxiliary component